MAYYLRKNIKKGSLVEITDKKGQVNRVKVTRIDDQAISGETTKGKVSIPLSSVKMAVAETDSPKGSSPQKGEYEGEVDWEEAGKVAGVVIISIAGEFFGAVGGAMGGF